VSQNLAQLVDRATAIANDYGLQAVRAWKQRTSGLAIGFLPAWVPRELLHAMGVLPVGIMGAGESLEIIRGDAFYQSYICHLPRSTIELGLNGSLDCLDGMLFPATCDVIRNLSGIWKLQFPDKLSRYIDVPQDFDPAMGGAFFRHELLELADELHRRGGAALSDTALRQSIALYNRHRAAVEALYALRIEAPHKVPTTELYVLLRAGQQLPVAEHTAMLERYRTLAAADATRRPMDQARVLFVGSFCEQPPLGLLKTLERSGCYIVDDDLVQVHRWIRGNVAVTGDPLDAVINAYLQQGVASPIRYIDKQQKGKDLVDRARASGAEGVIFAAASFCDPALLDQPMLTKAVDAAGIPWTAFKFSENTGQFQVIREQAGTFADSIKLWSTA
jgi:benzoyl-CoA reductase subunit C